MFFNNSKGQSDDVSDRNEVHVIGNGRKSDPCYKMARHLAELQSCPSVLWKGRTCKDEMTEAISKHSVETVASLLLNAYSKHGKKIP